MGLLIRQLGLETALYDDCYSACTLVFLGGVERKVWSPYPTLGFHRASIDGEAIPDSDSLYDRLWTYADSMTGNGSVVVRAMQSAQPSNFFQFRPEQLCDVGVATWVQRRCPQ